MKRACVTKRAANKYTARFLTLLLLCFLLASCGKPDLRPADTPSAELSESMKEQSVAESPENAALCDTARKLLELDGEVIDIFANQALADCAIGLEKMAYGYTVGDRYYPLDEACKYKSFDAVTSLLDSVYSRESCVAEEYLERYPRVGPPVLRQDFLGNTEFCCIYNAGFDTEFSDAAVSYLGLQDGVLRFQYSKGSSIYSFGMVETEDGYRLTDSLLFLYEKAVLAGTVSDTITENVGSAKRLTGDCLWINVLVDDGTSVWDAESASDLKEMLKTAGDYITKQAAEYGIKDLNFNYIWEETTTKLAAPHYSNGADWADRAFADRGGWASYVQSLLPAGYDGNYCIMFHFNKQGRSFCVPSDVNCVDDGYVNEFCAMFYSASKESGFFACPALYMHELLHAYGAVDLYEEALSEKGNALASIYFDKDIMRYEPAEIENCHVGLLTAKLLGWRNSIPTQLKDFLKERI